MTQRSTRKDQAPLIREVRAVLLAAGCDKAYWTAGGYCLQNKQAVHSPGFRLSQMDDRTACRVDYERAGEHIIWVGFDGGTVRPEALGAHYLRWYRMLARYEVPDHDQHA